MLETCLCNSPNDRPQSRYVHEGLLKWYLDTVPPRDMPNKAYCAWQSAVVSAIHPDEQPSRTQNWKSGAQKPSCHTILPRFSPTPMSTQMRSLCQCLQQWNLVLKDAICCDFHGQVDALQQIVAELRRSDCNESLFTVLDQMQCRKCLAMSTIKHDSFRCTVCGCLDHCGPSNASSIGMGNDGTANGVVQQPVEREKLSL